MGYDLACGRSRRARAPSDGGRGFGLVGGTVRGEQREVFVGALVVGFGRGCDRFRRARASHGERRGLGAVSHATRRVRAPCSAWRGLVVARALVVGSGLDVPVLGRCVLSQGLRCRLHEQSVNPEDVPGAFPPGLLPGGSFPRITTSRLRPVTAMEGGGTGPGVVGDLVGLRHGALFLQFPNCRRDTCHPRA